MLATFPVVVIFPGLLVNVQFPEGKPLKTTLPVAVLQVGWVIVPNVGAVGVVGCALINTFAEEEEEIHPFAFVTV